MPLTFEYLCCADLDYSSLLHRRRGPVAQSRGDVVPQRAPHVMQRSHGQNSDPDRSFRNRNNPIGMHASQNGQKMQGSGASRSICTFYNTDRGCRNGDTCTYAHVMRPPAACSNGHMHSQAASGSGGPVSRGAQQHALRITASGSAAQGNFSGNVAHMPGYMSAPAPAPAHAPVQSIAYEEALVCQYSVEADKVCPLIPQQGHTALQGASAGRNLCPICWIRLLDSQALHVHSSSIPAPSVGQLNLECKCALHAASIRHCPHACSAFVQRLLISFGFDHPRFCMCRLAACLWSSAPRVPC